MRRICVSVVLMAVLSMASVCSAAYMIYLKDGREITTQEYWEEGNQIKIRQYGGVVGIPKEDVVSIEETDDVRTIVIKSGPEKKTEDADEAAEKKPKDQDIKGKKEATEDGNKGKKSKDSEKPAPLEEKKEKNVFLKEFDSLKERIEKLESMTREEILQFDKDINGLRNKILKAGLGGVYVDLLVELSQMGDRAEEVYKKKSQ